MLVFNLIWMNSKIWDLIQIDGKLYLQTCSRGSCLKNSSHILRFWMFLFQFSINLSSGCVPHLWIIHSTKKPAHVLEFLQSLRVKKKSWLDCNSSLLLITCRFLSPNLSWSKNALCFLIAKCTFKCWTFSSHVPTLTPSRIRSRRDYNNLSFQTRMLNLFQTLQFSPLRVCLVVVIGRNS